MQVSRSDVCSKQDLDIIIKLVCRSIAIKTFRRTRKALIEYRPSSPRARPSLFFKYLSIQLGVIGRNCPCYAVMDCPRASGIHASKGAQRQEVQSEWISCDVTSISLISPTSRLIQGSSSNSNRCWSSENCSQRLSYGKNPQERQACPSWQKD